MAEGIKDDAGKLRFDLIPVEPLREVARVYTIGAKKYSDRNWEKGILWGRIFSALMRHATSYWGGERYDSVDGQHHLASVCWAALALMEYEKTHPELDDRPQVLKPNKQDSMDLLDTKLFKPQISGGEDLDPWAGRPDRPISGENAGV